MSAPSFLTRAKGCEVPRVTPKPIYSSWSVFELSELEFHQAIFNAGRNCQSFESLGEGRVKIQGVIYRSSSPASPQYVFRRRGDFWEIKFRGLKVHIAHQLGFEHIRRLIQNPGENCDCLQLGAGPALTFATLHSGGNRSKTKDDEHDEGRIVDYAKGDLPCIDKKAIGKILEEKHYLEEQLSEAKTSGATEKIHELEEKIDKIEGYLAETTYNGQPRHKGGDRSKARKAVSNAITRALKTLRVYHPALAKFLADRLSMGFTLSYTPDPAVNWRTD